ncbi:hypothetical protein C2G38_2247478 [Gigaspora rosea]|uniref:Uncharacterized protein n=1 Tax=Gigaspora rosea TaxID=44941 RepID=A0A397UZL7_9GLOM|nr:hypothetical protein C2G38_2247478 [Gigaspora rosea]
MDMLNENFFLESFISYINTSKPSLPRLEEFLYHTQDISKNGIRSCHKKLAHKTFFTQIQIISSLSKQSADIKCQYEYASYLDKKQLRSIKENRISSLFSSNSFDIFEEKFMQKNLLDSFYCMIIDLFHDSELWRNVLGTNFTRFKISKFELLNLKDISEINNSVKDSFENFNLQSINELQNPDISIEYFPSLNLKLSEGVYSERVKGSIIEILKLWIITWKKVEEIDEKDYVRTFIISPLEKLLGINLLRYVTIHGPEHPTYCSYECKSFFFNFDNLEASSCKVFESVNNEGSNNLKIYSKGIMSKKKYRKKVDIAISYRVENMINDRDQYGYFYPILGEAKLSNISADSDYNKLSRALNDNYNTIINYYSKKVKGITDNLVDLFSNIRLGGIHVTAGEIYLLQYTRYPNQKFGVLADISSSKISLKFEDQQAGYMIDLLYCVKIMVQDFIKQIQKIDKEIQRINESQNEEFDSKGEFLLNNILTTPTTPPVHKSD